MVYPLIIYAIRYVAIIVPSTMGMVDDGVVSSAIGFIFPIIIKVILFFVAIRAPFTWEKDVGGFVQSLPQTVAKGVQTVDRANRAVYGGMGTRAYQSYRKKGTDAFNQGIKDNEGNVQRIANRHMASAAGAAGVKQQLTEMMFNGIKTDQTTMDALKGKPPKFNEVAAAYDRWLNPAERARMTAPGASDEDKALAAYFTGNAARLQPEAAKQYRDQHVAENRWKYGEKAEREWRNNSPMAKWLMFQQEYVPSGISTYVNAWREGMAADMTKMEFRYNKPVQFLAGALGPEAYIKNHVQRKKGDHTPLDEEGLRKDMGEGSGAKDRREALILGANLGITDEGEAKAFHMLAHRKYFDAQETGAVYARMFYGKKADVDGKSQKIDGDMLASNISGYEKQRTLAASAARSTRAIEEQKYLREQQQARFWLTGAPSGAIAARTGVTTYTQGMAQAPISPAERKIIQGLEGIRRDIKSSSGIAALQSLTSKFANIPFDEVTGDDYTNLYFDAKDDRNTLNTKLMQEAGDDDGKKQQVSRFINDLDNSRGLEAPTLIARARQEFGENQETERLITEYSAKEQMKLVIEQNNPEARSLKQASEHFAQRASEDPSIIQQTRSSIDVYLRKQQGDRSITPDQLQQAERHIVEQFGLTDSDLAKPSMVRNLSQQMNVTTIRNPEIE